MLVVMRDEALGFGRCEVGVDLGGEVQFDLDGVQQRRDRAYISMNAFQDDRVAVRKIVADSRDIEAAVATSVVVWLFFVVLPDQPYQGQSGRNNPSS